MSQNRTIVLPRAARSARVLGTKSSRNRNRGPPYQLATIEKKGCRVKGRFYEVNERINIVSNACLDCRCDENGLMKCNPQVCSH